MAKSEKSLTKSVVSYLRSVSGLWYYKTHGGSGTRAGVPDILVCYEGRFFAPELKIPGNYPSPLQRNEIFAIREAGGIAEAVYSVDEVKELIQCQD